MTNPGIQVGTEVSGGDGGYVHIDQKDPSYQFTSYVYNRVYRSKNGEIVLDYGMILMIMVQTRVIL